MSNSEILDQFLKTLKMETSQKYHRALQARPILKNFDPFSKLVTWTLTFKVKLALKPPKFWFYYFSKFIRLEFYLQTWTWTIYWSLLKIGDLGLDHQGQIGLQTSKNFILAVKHWIT